jgi:hypothetical protein
MTILSYDDDMTKGAYERACDEFDGDTFREHQESLGGPVLWDASPGVCCAAFQLGACEHTEDFYDEDRDDDPCANDYEPTLVQVQNEDEPF